MERPRARFGTRSTIGHRRGYVEPRAKAHTHSKFFDGRTGHSREDGTGREVNRTISIAIPRITTKTKCTHYRASPHVIFGYIRFSRSHTTRQTLECGEVAARTALARSNDIALEARWHHLPLLFSRLGTLRHGARERSPRTRLAFPTHSRQSRMPGGEHDQMSRLRGGHRAPQKFA